MLHLSSREAGLELHVLNDYCHDALLERESAVYDPTARTFTMHITREAFEQRRLQRNLLVLRRYEVPLVSATLQFRSVSEASVDIPDVEDELLGAKLEDEGRRVILLGDRGARITLRVDTLDVSVLEEGQARVRHEWFVL